MKNDIQVEFLQAEAVTLAVISRLYTVYPEREWLLEFFQSGATEDFPIMQENDDLRQGLAWMNDYVQKHSALAEPDLDALRQDHTELFIGSGTLEAPPWGSIYLNKFHLLFQEETLDVRQWYARYDLQVERIFQEPDDHISHELSFIAFLAERAAQAAEQNQPELFADSMDAQVDFLRQHLLRWAPGFTARVVARAQTGFYRGLGAITGGLLQVLADELDLEIPEQPEYKN